MVGFIFLFVCGLQIVLVYGFEQVDFGGDGDIQVFDVVWYWDFDQVVVVFVGQVMQIIGFIVQYQCYVVFEVDCIQ